MNGEHQRTMPTLVGRGLYEGASHVRSEDNAGDGPSRRKPIAIGTQVAPVWLQFLLHGFPHRFDVECDSDRLGAPVCHWARFMLRVLRFFLGEGGTVDGCRAMDADRFFSLYKKRSCKVFVPRETVSQRGQLFPAMSSQVKSPAAPTRGEESSASPLCQDEKYHEPHSSSVSPSVSVVPRVVQRPSRATRPRPYCIELGPISRLSKTAHRFSFLLRALPPVGALGDLATSGPSEHTRRVGTEASLLTEQGVSFGFGVFPSATSGSWFRRSGVGRSSSDPWGDWRLISVRANNLLALRMITHALNILGRGGDMALVPSPGLGVWDTDQGMGLLTHPRILKGRTCACVYRDREQECVCRRFDAIGSFPKVRMCWQRCRGTPAPP